METKLFLFKDIDFDIDKISDCIVTELEVGLYAKLYLDLQNPSSPLELIFHQFLYSPELLACLIYEQKKESEFCQLIRRIYLPSSEDKKNKVELLMTLLNKLEHGQLKTHEDYIETSSMIPYYYKVLFIYQILPALDSLSHYYARSPSEVLSKGRLPLIYENIDRAFERLTNLEEDFSVAFKNEIINICPDINPDAVLATNEDYEAFYKGLIGEPRKKYVQVYSNLCYMLNSKKMLKEVFNFGNIEIIKEYDPKAYEELLYITNHMKEPQLIKEMMEGNNRFVYTSDLIMESILDFLDDKSSPYVLKAKINSILDNCGFDELITEYKEKHASKTTISRAVPYDLFDERPNFDSQDEFIPNPTSNIKFLDHGKSSYEEYKDETLSRFQKFLTYLYESGYLYAADIPLFAYRMTGRNRPEGKLRKIKWANVHDRSTDHGPELLYIVQGLSEASRNKFDRLPLFFDGPDFNDKCKPKDAAASFKNKLSEIYPNIFKSE